MRHPRGSLLFGDILFPVMSTLVECVPNFSEGRDKAKVDAIVEAMKMDGVFLLDREMDSDHNRCVITLVGEREPMQEAAIRGVGKAAELIDGCPCEAGCPSCVGPIGEIGERGKEAARRILAELLVG